MSSEIYNPDKLVRDPLVSVCIVTYNHKEYIVECLEGVLKQQTSFPFEIIIGEDESSDGTREICLEYAERYPELIRLFLRSRKDNIAIDGRPSGRHNFLETIKAPRGKYIAWLCGDDYWTDPEKLQLQVDVLENNPGIAVCFHGGQTQIIRPDSISFEKLPGAKQVTTLNDLARGNYIYTSSGMFRNRETWDLPDWFRWSPIADWPLHMYNAMTGDVYYIDRDMFVYRLHDKGIWSLTPIARRYERMLEFCLYLKENFLPSEHHAQLDHLIFDSHYRIAYGNRLADPKKFEEHFRICRQTHGYRSGRMYKVLVLYLMKYNIVVQEQSGLKLRFFARK